MDSSREQSDKEFEDVTVVDQESERANIHAVVTSVSPMKSSASGRTNYFGCKA